MSRVIYTKTFLVFYFSYPFQLCSPLEDRLLRSLVITAVKFIRHVQFPLDLYQAFDCLKDLSRIERFCDTTSSIPVPAWPASLCWRLPNLFLWALIDWMLLKHLKVIMSKIELVMIPPNLLFAILVRDPSIQAEDWEMSVTPFYLILFLICHQDHLISIYKLNLKFTYFSISIFLPKLLERHPSWSSWFQSCSRPGYSSHSSQVDLVACKARTFWRLPFTLG